MSAARFARPSRRPFATALAAFFLLIVPGAAQAAKRYAFATSVSGTGDLGSWPDAGSATGIAACALEISVASVFSASMRVSFRAHDSA